MKNIIYTSALALVLGMASVEASAPTAAPVAPGAPAHPMNSLPPESLKER